MILRVCAGISVFIGVCALPVSLPLALPLIIIGGLIMFIGDVEKEKEEEESVEEYTERINSGLKNIDGKKDD
ncbi:hypothetical protein OAX35_00075 [Candidatus Pelagibacter ubique]|nr:hypothetical protein [Candidatus Pelagibacter ubique]